MNPQDNNVTPPANNTPPQMQPQPQPQFQPMQPQPMPQFTAVAPAKRSPKLKFLLIGVLVSLFIFGGSAAAYVKLVVNSPENVWKRAMSSSAQGLDAIMLSYDQNKGGTKKLEGTFKLSSPAAVDGSLQLISDDKNAEMTMDIGALGSRITAEMRAVDSDLSENPDVYFKLSGVDDIATLLGFADASYGEMAGIIQSLDKQWYAVDHTLLDEALASSAQSSTTPELTPEEINKIAQAVSSVVKNNLLSTDPQRAVFEVVRDVGKEDFEGTDTYRYEVTVNKEHLKLFLNDMKSALESTKVKELVEASSGKSYADAINFDELFQSIDKQDFSKAKADVWIEASGRYVRNVRIYPNETEKEKNYIDVGMPYTGGDIFPFVVKVTTDDNGTSGTASFGVDFNKANADVRAWGKLDMKDDTDTYTGEYDFTVKSTAESPNTDKPTDAKSIMDLLGAFGLGDTSSMGLEQMYAPGEMEALMNQNLNQTLDDDTELQ